MALAAEEARKTEQVVESQRILPMKINEFLTEIQHAAGGCAEKIGTIVSSDRALDKRISGKIGFCMTGTELCFYKKILLEKDYRLVFLYYLCRMGAGNL